jgi:hypothetical protein
VPERPVPNRLMENVEDVSEEELTPPSRLPVSPPPQRRAPKRSSPGTATVYVSQGVKARLEDYRSKLRRTNRDVILEAITACHGSLKKIIEASTVSTAPASMFTADPKAVRYLGGGGVQVQFTPTPTQAQELDKIGKDLGFERRSTWIAPILNEFLPGRKEKP